MIELLDKSAPIPYDLLLIADESVESIDKYIHNSDIFTYKSGDILWGLYALQKIDEVVVEIKNIAVFPEYQGRGIGQFMLIDAIRRAKTMGFKRITIGTGDLGVRQIKLYQKVGFEIYDVKKNFFVDNFPEPIYEDGKQLVDMVMLKIDL